jgi:hypothetical protein
VADIAHWAAMNVNEARKIITRFVAQGRLELTKDRIVVKNITEFSRFVAAKRKQLA